MSFVLSLMMAPSRANDVMEQTLKSNTGFSVMVEGPKELPLLDAAGLTTSQFQTEVELRCRKYGLNVSSKISAPFLYLNVSLMPIEDFVVYNFEISFHQKAMLFSTKQVSIVNTWNDGTTGTCGNDRLNLLHDKAGALVDKFINAYLAQNPRGQ